MPTIIFMLWSVACLLVCPYTMTPTLRCCGLCGSQIRTRQWPEEIFTWKKTGQPKRSGKYFIKHKKNCVVPHLRKRWRYTKRCRSTLRGSILNSGQSKDAIWLVGLLSFVFHCLHHVTLSISNTWYREFYKVSQHTILHHIIIQNHVRIVCKVVWDTKLNHDLTPNLHHSITYNSIEVLLLVLNMTLKWMEFVLRFDWCCLKLKGSRDHEIQICIFCYG